MAKNRTGAFLGGVLVGSAIGTTVAILLAPRAGKDTRRLLGKSVSALPEMAEDLSSSANWHAARLGETTRDRVDGTLARLKEAIAAGWAAGQLEIRAAQAERSSRRQ